MRARTREEDALLRGWSLYWIHKSQSVGLWARERERARRRGSLLFIYVMCRARNFATAEHLKVKRSNPVPARFVESSLRGTNWMRYVAARTVATIARSWWLDRASSYCFSANIKVRAWDKLVCLPQNSIFFAALKENEKSINAHVVLWFEQDSQSPS